jgi:hypothetical protein
MPSIDFSGKVKSSFTRRLAISGRDYARKLRAGLDELNAQRAVADALFAGPLRKAKGAPRPRHSELPHGLNGLQGTLCLRQGARVPRRVLAAPPAPNHAGDLPGFLRCWAICSQSAIRPEPSALSDTLSARRPRLLRTHVAAPMIRRSHATARRHRVFSMCRDDRASCEFTGYTLQALALLA